MPPLEPDEPEPLDDPEGLESAIADSPNNEAIAVSTEPDIHRDDMGGRPPFLDGLHSWDPLYYRGAPPPKAIGVRAEAGSFYEVRTCSLAQRGRSALRPSIGRRAKSAPTLLRTRFGSSSRSSARTSPGLSAA